MKSLFHPKLKFSFPSSNASSLKRSNSHIPFISSNSSSQSVLRSFHTSSSTCHSSLLTFYNYSVRTANGEWFHLKNLKGKVTLVTVCNISNENYRKYLYDLADFKYSMNSRDFEIMVIPKLDSILNARVIEKALENQQSPIQQFLSDEAKTSSTLSSSLKLKDIIVCRGIPNSYISEDSSQTFDTDLELYNNVSSEIGDALNYLCNYAEGSAKTILEDFEKFVVSRNGRVVFRSGNNYSLEALRDIIQRELQKGTENLGVGATVEKVTSSKKDETSVGMQDQNVKW
ncbi:hypothetical protein C9374_009806 [Naegleria lovaniensis]|uniref:Uncharacterized protein n=1 Tax=Naegleria lovaniensis TaxID=51637 RepID=A0AA88H404_NAELO|nr:uncharacterized protein C9374_009806 [Naegleria lovaniensis]KAG2393229.1 hypothetical protein C9374_009806 [Naegleria lovaniensis]